jgi:putative peptidoglycan lipid II flippase
MIGLGAAMSTGYLRQAALAYEIGAGRAVDVYLLAFAVPEFVFVALPIVLSPAFIPLFSALRLHSGERAAWRFALRVGGALLAALVGFAIAVALSAPLYMRWLAPDLGRVELGRAVRAAQMMAPAIILMGESALIGALLRACRCFGPPAISAAVYNIAFVAVLLAAPVSQPVRRTAYGVTLGAAAALTIQLPFLWHYHRKSSGSAFGGRSDRGPINIRVGDMVRLAGLLLAAYAAHHVILIVDRAMAVTRGVGGAAILNYAYRVALITGQLSGLAVSTAIFPSFAEQAANEDDEGLRSGLSASLRLVWMIGLPASCWLAAMRVPVVQLLFQRGAFGPAAGATVSDVLVVYVVAVLADALCQPLWRVLYAWRRTRTVLMVNGLQTLVRLLLNIALIQRFGYVGLALSATLGLATQLLLLGRLVRRQMGTFLSATWWRSGLRAIMATALGMPVAVLVAQGLHPWPAAAVLLASGVAGGLTYVVGLRFLGEAMV